MADLSSQRKRLIVASETTYGVDAVQPLLTSATDALIYQEVESSSVVPKRSTVTLARQRATIQGNRNASEPDTVEVNATGPLTGRGPSETPPDYAPFLRAAMLSQGAFGSAGYVYRVSTAQSQSMTAYEWTRELDGDLWRLDYAPGIRGTLTLNLTQGEEAKWTFAGQGIYKDLVSPAAAFFNASTLKLALLKDGATAVPARTGAGIERKACNAPMIARAMTVTYDGVAMPISDLEISFNIDMSIKRVMTGNPGAVVAVRGTRSTDGAITGSMTLIDGATAHDKVYAAWKSDARFPFVAVLTDGDGGSGSERITLTGSQVQVADITRGDVEGAMSHTVPLRFVGDCSSLLDGTDFSMTYDEVP